MQTVSQKLHQIQRQLGTLDWQVFSVRTLLLALIISVLLTAANAYVGLMVGLTVSASIPAAALAMAILSRSRSAGIKQANMIQTSASAGEALAAGVIFTIPALVISQHWASYSFPAIFLLALSGGFLGVIFTIPLRKALIVERALPYPEGVATAQILKAGEFDTQSGYQSLGARHLLQATGVSALYKLLQSGFGMLAGSVAWNTSVSQGKLPFFFSMQLSPAMLGVGYILGIRIAILVFIGGLIGSLFGIPINWLLRAEQIAPQITGLSANTDLSQLSQLKLSEINQFIWQENRRIGVGALLVGGIWSLIEIIKPVLISVKTNLNSFKNWQRLAPNEAFDLPLPLLLALVPLLLLAPGYMFINLLGLSWENLLLTGICLLLLVLFAFVFASVAAYMAGIVGSSHNPISGVTIITVVLSALFLYQTSLYLPIVAQLGPALVLFLAAVICSAAAISGDNMQDLKCGSLIGALPWQQQIFQLFGVTIAALILPFILYLLDASYGIGRPLTSGGQYLPAPQAALMADLATSVFDDSLVWSFVYLGAAIAVVFIIVDQICRLLNIKQRFHVLAIAIGIYLPLGLSTVLLVGALIASLVKYKSHRNQRQQSEQAGILLASGLVTGEALMGVLLAIVASFVMPLASPIEMGSVTGLCAFILVAYYLYKRTRRPTAGFKKIN
ncbi:OPT family oligopeptide transporter [Gayadomonas joobiniege]|uniref:OPT family oligopeptide transporter n=1 Tax=Gayadomonas joobiniege TaxID=1234606 RepID=UPI00036373DE|nr:oligopeptide transporter, OPT family [Gayadomonas joobiniege]